MKSSFIVDEVSTSINIEASNIIEYLKEKCIALLAFSIF